MRAFGAGKGVLVAVRRREQFYGNGRGRIFDPYLDPGDGLDVIDFRLDLYVGISAFGGEYNAVLAHLVLER